MSCATCRYFIHNVYLANSRGQCRRYPPASVTDVWPIVDRDAWCGEYARDERKMAVPAKEGREAGLVLVAVKPIVKTV